VESVHEREHNSGVHNAVCYEGVSAVNTINVSKARIAIKTQVRSQSSVRFRDKQWDYVNERVWFKVSSRIPINAMPIAFIKSVKNEYN
jgi:hypothetical protein